MAIMIPDVPHEFDPASQEGIMFDSLKRLPNDYYVFHSFKITTIRENTVFESETDFVIFNRNKGVLCLEAKAGLVKYEKEYWYYSSGIPMHNGGPFNQASSNKYKLIRYVERSRLSGILPRCKFLHAVWFPSVTEAVLRTMTLPSEADKALILTKEALSDPEPFIERIYAIELPNKVTTDLSDYEIQRLIREVFCPQFNVFPSATFENDLKKIVFHRLLNEQAGILNFLSEQKTAVINGAAGTGKTMIAVERAQRHANDGQKVLFLCFNNQLKSYLQENYANDNISYYTIAGLACKMCGTSSPDYAKFKTVLEDIYLSESFPYQHVIIDEGQDFGSDSIEEANLLQQIKEIITDNEALNGTFYVFYDKLQLIQAQCMPKFIEDADCKLTLYRNCRNTENIATTSLRPITERKPILLDGCVKGPPAKLHFCPDGEAAVRCVEEIVKSLNESGYKDIVLLTCKTEDESVLSAVVRNGMYKDKLRFTTCRKFKGLEADAVVLVDVDGESFNSENVLIYYVGTSRARLKLDIVAELTDDDCIDILRSSFMRIDKIKKPKKELASALNAIGSVIAE